MSKLCAIDFGDRRSPDNTALRTSVARLVVELVRSDLANRSRDAAAPMRRPQLLSALRTFCRPVSVRHLLDAGQEFGVDVEGFGISEF